MFIEEGVEDVDEILAGDLCNDRNEENIADDEIKTTIDGKVFMT